MTRSIGFVLVVVACGCGGGSSGPSPIPGPGSPDARPGSVDANPRAPDANPSAPDAARPAPDARPSPSDGGTTSPDAGPGSPDASTPSPDAAPSGIAACGPLAYSMTFSLTPAPTGAHYTRCDTRGPEHAAKVALASDAAHVAVVTSAGTVRLFATSPWSEIAQLAAAEGRIDAIAFSPDGATLATLAPELGQVTLWRASDGQRGTTYTLTPTNMIEHTDSALAFSADGTQLATSLGAIIDLTTGATTSIATDGTEHELAFTPGNAMVYERSEFQIGNSPPTTRLSLLGRDGSYHDLFLAYTRALQGSALSPDHALVAYGQTDEAGGASVREYRASDGSLVGSVAGTWYILGYSPNGARLYAWNAGVVSALDPSDLHVVRAAPVAFTPDQFLGVSPDDHLVASGNGATTWTDPATGAVARTLAHALTSATWSGDGGYGAGAASDAMFVLWRESDANARCAAPAISGTAPAVSSLGTVLPYDTSTPQTITSQDGTTSATSTFSLHTHATNYFDIKVTDVASGAELRAFTPSAFRTFAMGQPSAAELFTLESPDTAVAGWCR